MSATVKSADRVLQVFELLTDAPDGLLLAEIQRALGLPKSSAHALVSTMAGRGFIEQDPHSRRYAVGIRLWQAGRSYLTASSLENLALPYMSQIRADLNETVQLATLDGTDNVYLAKVDPDHQLRLASHVGARLPAYATGIGKALLSLLPDEEIKRRFADTAFTAFTPQTHSSLDDLLAVIRHVRTTGHAEDHGEYTTGVFCVAMPLKNSPDHRLAALSVSVPEVRKAPDLVDRALESLRRATTEISQRLS